MFACLQPFSADFGQRPPNSTSKSAPLEGVALEAGRGSVAESEVTTLGAQQVCLDRRLVSELVRKKVFK